ncbi:MAG: SUKH-3 domain-containing protein [Phycisphaerales bacterium]|nr:SUKH-3 domain-containing protein [Phycisphaerales bacterium]MCB9858769.1 SUKH-3 domain-containing protein [Phycisphaerales bacterium]
MAGMRAVRYLLLSILVGVIAARVVSSRGAVGYSSSGFQVYVNASTFWVVFEPDSVDEAVHAPAGWSVGKLGAYSDGLIMPTASGGRFGIPYWLILLVAAPAWYDLHMRARAEVRRRRGRLCQSCSAVLSDGDRSLCAACQEKRAGVDEWETVIREQLVPAGWTPSRDVWDSIEKPDGLQPFSEARRILGSYGDLEFWTRERDRQVVLRPSVAAEYVDQIRFLASQVGHALYPIGSHTIQDEVYLLVDDRGVVFELDVWESGGNEPAEASFELYPYAGTFEIAMDALMREADPIARRWNRDFDSEFGRLGVLNQGYLVEERRNDGELSRCVEVVAGRWKRG